MITSLQGLRQKTKDKIVSREDAMDVLILHLDRSVCLAPGIPATQRWEHLADQFKVPDDVKSQCANFSGKLSSSESLFVQQKTPSQ